MTEKRRLVHAIFLIALPIIVAWFGFSTLTALALVVLALLWRWTISLSGIAAPERTPRLVLETTPASHFVEKVRWCMDRLGVKYTERPSAGVLGAAFGGRTLPRLKVRTGIVVSSLGNSHEILRYLWGEYAGRPDTDASFLEPSPERLQLEKRIDRYGVDLQVWIYYHSLLDRDLVLHVWGADSPLVPQWQKLLLKPLFPVLALFVRKSFSITDEHYAKAVEHIDDMLGDIDMRLADGRRSILGGDEPDFVDIAFAAMSGLWLQPQHYGGGKADACRIARNRLAAPMRADIERWIEDHPKASAFIMRLYSEERLSGTTAQEAGQTDKVHNEADTGAER